MSHMRLCPTPGGVGGTGGKVAGLRDRPWIWTSHKQTDHCTNAWLVFTRKEEDSHLDLGLSWDKVGQEEPEERKGQGLGGLSLEDMTAAALSPSPPAFHPPLPTCPEEASWCPQLGQCWKGQEGRDPLLVTQHYWIIPPHDPASLSCLCP